MRISDWSSDVCSSDLAEAVAYSLQALGRATIVGETTGGGAHPFEYRRVHEHFAVDLPEGKSINPVTGTNWQGTGVKPDVEVPDGQALDTAIRSDERHVGTECVRTCSTRMAASNYKQTESKHSLERTSRKQHT